MRNYRIYLLEEEFATHYFGRESLLYQLFLDHKETTQVEYKEILEQQINFITRPIPNLKINQIISVALKKYKTYQQNKSSHFLKFQLPEGEAKLSILDGYLYLEAKGNLESETIFFELLRKYNPCFLAMDFEQNRYGWLNPIKERKFV